MKGLELFAGSGTVSRVFRENGWEMDEVEILRGSDVRTFHPVERYDFVWASPPCPQYSYGVRGRTYRDIYEADRELWLHALRIVQEARPRFWVVENVKGAQQVWGRAPYHFGSFFLWGYYPVPTLKWDWSKSLKGTHNFQRTGGPRYDEGFSPAQKAVIPVALAEAVCRGVTRDL